MPGSDEPLCGRDGSHPPQSPRRRRRHPARRLRVVFAAFLTLLRSIGSDPSPGLLSAQGMAHRLLVGRESLHTDVQRGGEYRFRVVYQASDGNVAGTELATHIGVEVCLRGDRATDAVRFAYLHFRAACNGAQVALTPAETSVVADRKAYGGEFVKGADQPDEPTPRRIGSP